MCSPILWLAARPQRIARFAAFHVDCAPSAHEKVAIDSTQKIVAVVKCIGWEKHCPYQLAIRRMCDDSPRNILRNNHSPYPKLVQISATIFCQFMTQKALQFVPWSSPRQ